MLMEESMNLKSLTLIGANGIMGANIAAIFASFGRVKVYMIARTMDKAIAAKERDCKSIKDDRLNSLLVPKTYNDLKECIKESDAVFESVCENFETKFEINQSISKYLTPDKYVFTGTSGISISELAKAFSEDIAKHYCGMHFSNPPYSMTMGEMIKGESTDISFFEEACAYAKDILRRDVFVANDTPGFLGNRIAFRLLNEALQGAVDEFDDKGGIDYIDSLFRGYTGRLMAPLKTINLAKLNVYKPIVDNIYEKMQGIDPFVDDYKMPDKINKLMDIQSNEGVSPCIYTKTDNVSKVYDVKTNEFRDVQAYRIEWIDEINGLLREGYYDKARDVFLSIDTYEARFCKKLLVKYILHALMIAHNENVQLKAVDIAIASGYNWCPPLALIEYFGGKDTIKTLVKELKIDIDVEMLLKDVIPSDYDYRRYLRVS